MDSLPFDVIGLLLSFCDLPAIVSLAQTNKRNNRFIVDKDLIGTWLSQNWKGLSNLSENILQSLFQLVPEIKKPLIASALFKGHVKTWNGWHHVSTIQIEIPSRSCSITFEINENWKMQTESQFSNHLKWFDKKQNRIYEGVNNGFGIGKSKFLDSGIVCEGDFFCFALVKGKMTWSDGFEIVGDFSHDKMPKDSTVVHPKINENIKNRLCSRTITDVMAAPQFLCNVNINGGWKTYCQICRDHLSLSNENWLWNADAHCQCTSQECITQK
eukprot:TRINITY_DN6636_c0_g2_i1.p1 TRINITY_DN6636_c0_g2~~TRINITY_DN6636_c0_g2_i1.p1  ORF type:complete len:271 (+),score=44.39 TRINITY_DN6636_c0_g2_i1:38-850(+)